MQLLRSNASIIIKPADKNLGLTVMDKSWYDNEMARQLNDSRYYRTVANECMTDVTHTLQYRLRNIADRWLHSKAIPYNLYEYIMQGKDFTKPAHIYLIPKIHKPKLAGRVICPSHSWITTRVSTWLAAELNEIARQQPTVLFDSRQLIRMLHGMKVSRDALLVTFDVESLYPNIDHTIARESIASYFPQGSAKRECILEFLDFVMQNNYFTFRDQYYHQIHGTAMGTSVAPPYANLDLACMETDIMSQFDTKPRIYARFIDDGFMIWEGNRETLMKLLHAWNSHRPNIRITTDISEFQCHMLDLVIYKDMMCMGNQVPIYVRTYEKPMNKYLYIPFSSFHSRAVLKGFIKSRLINYVVTCSMEQDFITMREKFKQRLLDRAYPVRFLNTVFDTVHYSDRHALLFSPKPQETTSTLNIFADFTNVTAKHLNLNAIVQRVHADFSHHPDIQQMTGGTDPLVVYKKGRSLQRILVNAKH